jgi:hypothetical protein
MDNLITSYKRWWNANLNGGSIKCSNYKKAKVITESYKDYFDIPEKIIEYAQNPTITARSLDSVIVATLKN